MHSFSIFSLTTPENNHGDFPNTLEVFKNTLNVWSYFPYFVNHHIIIIIIITHFAASLVFKYKQSCILVATQRCYIVNSLFQELKLYTVNIQHRYELKFQNSYLRCIANLKVIHTQTFIFMHEDENCVKLSKFTFSLRLLSYAHTCKIPFHLFC